MKKSSELEMQHLLDSDHQDILNPRIKFPNSNFHQENSIPPESEFSVQIIIPYVPREQKYQLSLVSIWLERIAAEWIGREISPKFLTWEKFGVEEIWVDWFPSLKWGK